MLLTHLCFFQFLGGASPVVHVVGSSIGGSSTMPPFYMFDGFTGVETPDAGEGPKYNIAMFWIGIGLNG